MMFRKVVIKMNFISLLFFTFKRPLFFSLSTFNTSKQLKCFGKTIIKDKKVFCLLLYYLYSSDIEGISVAKKMNISCNFCY